jgi:hypothetical protein
MKQWCPKTLGDRPCTQGFRFQPGRPQEHFPVRPLPGGGGSPFHPGAAGRTPPGPRYHGRVAGIEEISRALLAARARWKCEQMGWGRARIAKEKGVRGWKWRFLGFGRRSSGGPDVGLDLGRSGGRMATSVTNGAISLAHCLVAQAAHPGGGGPALGAGVWRLSWGSRLWRRPWSRP